MAVCILIHYTLTFFYLKHSSFYPKNYSTKPIYFTGRPNRNFTSYYFMPIGMLQENTEFLYN